MERWFPSQNRHFSIMYVGCSCCRWFVLYGYSLLCFVNCESLHRGIVGGAVETYGVLMFSDTSLG